MLSDEQILQRGGTEEDIANYAHDVGGACGAIYGGTCDHCGKKEKLRIPYDVFINYGEKYIKENPEKFKEFII